MKKMRKFISNIFGGQDLYELAAKNNIHIIEENLGNQIAGYYNNTFGEKLIHVNSEIPSYCKTLVIAYFLPKDANKCTDISYIDFLTMERLLNTKISEEHEVLGDLAPTF